MELPADVIPSGIYCYSLRPHPTEPGKLEIFDKCPYLRDTKIAGVNVVWCDFLQSGSVPNGTTDEEYRKLKHFYGSEEALDEDLPLLLLWDGCKECGVNREEIS